MQLPFTLLTALRKPVLRQVVVQMQCAFVTLAIVGLLLRQGIRRPFTPQTVQPKLVLQTVLGPIQFANVIPALVEL